MTIDYWILGILLIHIFHTHILINIHIKLPNIEKKSIFLISHCMELEGILNIMSNES